MQKSHVVAAKALVFDMPKVKILPHPEICPEGAVFELNDDESLCEGALRNGLKIEHACELSCACTTCHCIVREGFESLEEPSETEEDMLDKAWGLEPQSRLSCQIYPGKKDLVVELPKYTVNQVSEEI